MTPARQRRLPDRTGGPAFQARKFADEAVEVIRHLILSGEMAPGERLNELSLAQSLGISRSPIREGLQALAGEGLVRFVAGRGAFVAEIDLAAVCELGEIREGLECMAARVAAERATEAQLDELDRMLTETETSLGLASPTPSDCRPYPRDLDFHQQLLQTLGNSRLTQLASSVSTQLQLARLRSGQTPGRARAACAEHRAILDALRRRDPAAAESAMREHLRQALHNVQHLLEAPEATG